VLKRSSRAGVEDRWHRPARKGEQVPRQADSPGPGCWCVDPGHGTTGTLVTTVRHGQGKRWLARWVDHDSNERAKAFDRKAEAKRHITNITTAMTTGTYADPQRGAVTFAAMAEPWFDSKSGLKPKTQAGYRSLLDVLALPRWGETPLRDITHADIQAWVHVLATDPSSRQRKVRDVSKAPRGLSPSRVVQAYQVVDQVLRYAVRTRRIGLNPADDVQLPRTNKPDKTSLTHDQIRQIADAAGDLKPAVYVLAYGGMRIGELAALRVGNVDTARNRLTVSRSVTAVAKIGIVETDTKTHQSRVVPLPAFVMDLVEITGKQPSDLVFPHHDGGWMPRDWFALRLEKACLTAGLARVTPHTLRHTAGSLALAAGATIVTVSKMLGHKDVTTTMNIYAHQLPDDFDNLTAAMDSAARTAAAR
jgi:integrase